MDFENISRRSFLKTTTVLAVGIASVTLFSGLVNASEQYSPYVDDKGNCIFKEDGGFAGSCSYNPFTTYIFACSASRFCCYHYLICNGKESIGKAWSCPTEEGEERTLCLSHEQKEPALLPYCQPLG